MSYSIYGSISQKQPGVFIGSVASSNLFNCSIGSNGRKYQSHVFEDFKYSKMIEMYPNKSKSWYWAKFILNSIYSGARFYPASIKHKQKIYQEWYDQQSEAKFLKDRELALDMDIIKQELYLVIDDIDEYTLYHKILKDAELPEDIAERFLMWDVYTLSDKEIDDALNYYKRRVKELK